MKENNEEKIISFPNKEDDEVNKSVKEKEKDDAPKFSYKRIIFYFSIVLCLSMIIYLIVRDTSFDSTNTVNESPIILSGANNFDYARYREGFVLAKDGKISAFNTNQELQWEFTGSKTAPTIVVNDKYCLVYYCDDKMAVVTNGKDMSTLKTSGNVMYGHVNSNGWSVLFVEEAGLNNKIIVYDDEGEQIYLRQNADRYIPYAFMSDDNDYLVLLEMFQSEAGLSTEINIVDITETEDNKKTINFGEQFVNGFFMYSENEFVVIKENSIEGYDIDGELSWNTPLNKLVLKYAYNDDDIFALIFNEDDSATAGSEIKFFETDGTELSSYKTDKKITDIDLCDNNAVLRADRKLILINTKGKYISTSKVLYDIRDSAFMTTKKCSLILTSSEELRLIPLE